MTQKKTLKVRQELKWHVVSQILENLETMSILYKDEEYHRLLSALIEHVSDKIEPLDGNDILDLYVVMEQT